ncbi:MAG: hypothetical protein L6R37_002539 [Teloschistes peruensis]|nr:MAG: hypothetical protein L6R37_002539 [Teloschistes peruensis]
MRRDPREDSRGLVDPRDAPELLDNDGYDPTEMPERQPVEGINPIEILAVANVEVLIHARNKWIGEEGKDKETNTAHGMKSCLRPSAISTAKEADVLGANHAIDTKNSS